MLPHQSYQPPTRRPQPAGGDADEGGGVPKGVTGGVPCPTHLYTLVQVHSPPSSVMGEHLGYLHQRERHIALYPFPPPPPLHSSPSLLHNHLEHLCKRERHLSPPTHAPPNSEDPLPNLPEEEEVAPASPLLKAYLMTRHQPKRPHCRILWQGTAATQPTTPRPAYRRGTTTRSRCKVPT